MKNKKEVSGNSPALTIPGRVNVAKPKPPKKPSSKWNRSVALGVAKNDKSSKKSEMFHDAEESSEESNDDLAEPQSDDWPPSDDDDSSESSPSQTLERSSHSKHAVSDSDDDLTAEKVSC